MRNEPPRNGYIGIFDSGFGGLDVMRGIVEELPAYDYLYLGDTARTPYGTRSQEAIRRFTREAVDFLFGEGCRLVILACNTASSEALRFIQMKHLPGRYPRRNVLGVLIPAVEAAARASKNKRIGVLATESTVLSGAFVSEIHKLAPDTQVAQQACPLLVPIVEAGEHDSEIADAALRRYLEPLKRAGVDTVILGCTHYGLLQDRIGEILGAGVTIISQRNTVPEKLRDYLDRHPEYEQVLSKRGAQTFCTTDLTPRFAALGTTFYGREIEVMRVTLEQ